MSNKLFLCALVMSALLFTSLAPQSAHATESTKCSISKIAGGIGPEKEQMNEKFIATTSTIFTDIIARVKLRLALTSNQIYQVVILNPQYLLAVNAAITLYVVIYGILFTSGMIQAKLYDVIIRMLKIGVVALILTPASSWWYFNNFLIKFFDEITNKTIDVVSGASTIAHPIANSATTGFYAMANLDSLVRKAISPHMFATISAAATTGAYGIFYGLLLVAGVVSLLRSLVIALWVYIMSLVMKTILLGLAPLFIPTLLFQRTRHIFDGWVAQLVNATLQPILLFIFFVFFVKLLEGSLNIIFQVPVCFSEIPGTSVGTSLDNYFWRFMDHASGSWEVSKKEFTFKDEHPLPLIAVLSFFVIAELAAKFNTVVIQISTQISQASTNFGGDGPFQTLFTAVRGRNRVQTTK